MVRLRVHFPGFIDPIDCIRLIRFVADEECCQLIHVSHLKPKVGTDFDDADFCSRKLKEQDKKLYQFFHSFCNKRRTISTKKMKSSGVLGRNMESRMH